MSIPPIPVVFEPLFKAKPWGGRRLATLLNKKLPGHDPIGESWELVSLPENESRVRGGPLAGVTLTELVNRWGRQLLGPAAPFAGRFPLLIKFLDAAENLSVQVHPKPAAPGSPQVGLKHECWYVLHTEPGARLYIGLKPGVTPADVARAANTPAMADLLHVWDGRPGQCYYLPSGTLHALGAGLVVAEIQTPSDITYRAYDWDRVGLDGRPRELHIEQTLANTRYDVTEQMIVQPRTPVTGPGGQATRIAACECFVMDLRRAPRSHGATLPTGELRIWVVLTGRGRLTRQSHECPFAAGDVILIPADCGETVLELSSDAEWIDVTIPTHPA